ncbi:uncharacterized protein si:ch73-204p21.2 [Cheilinus undulatus]|uniref:uncharacterized protein si:ch73-204p21.2 n=1 Tax=Cheilinus undulatus TaxID=241271 RepID=UPI001BD627E0|nr:uncharacterized protein si:ch73-204p21.2 [Cheilinus undulatus]
MAAVGAEVTASSFFFSSGVVSFFILLLLLSIFLTALCSDCGRRSFELREPEDKNPSALIRVVKLEEAMVARENPMISEIQKDEKDFRSVEESTVSFSTARIQQGAPPIHNGVQTNGSTVVGMTEIDPKPAEDSNPEDEITVTFTPWRSHLRAPQSPEVNISAPSDSARFYNNTGGRRGSSGEADVSSPVTNHILGEEVEDLSERDVRSVYAQVNRQARLATPTHQTPEELQMEEASPPLSERKTAVEA